MTYFGVRLRPFQFLCAVLVGGLQVYGCGSSNSPADSGQSNSTDPEIDDGEGELGDDDDNDEPSGGSSIEEQPMMTRDGGAGGGSMDGGTATTGLGDGGEAGTVTIAATDAGAGDATDGMTPRQGSEGSGSMLPTMDYPATGYLLRETLSWGNGDRIFMCRANCTITMITSNVAMTAAHCVDDLNPPLPIVPLAVGFGQVCEGHNAGVDLVDVPSPTSTDNTPAMMGATTVPRYNSVYHVLSVKQAPGYNRASRDNDIAYIVLDKPVPGLTPAKLPKRTSVTGQVQHCEAFAVDYDAMNKRSVGPICVERYDYIDGRIYVDGDGSDSMLCFNDTGGPLYTEGTTLAGVLQDFHDCTRLGGAIYTAVHDHLEFIRLGLEAGQRALTP